jgi:hypothetical protein
MIPLLRLSHQDYQSLQAAFLSEWLFISARFAVFSGLKFYALSLASAEQEDQCSVQSNI